MSVLGPTIVHLIGQLLSSGAFVQRCGVDLLRPASRIWLSTSEHVLQEAEKIIRTIMSMYPQPNLAAEQVESQAANGKDPLRHFSDTCRTELDSLQPQL